MLLAFKDLSIWDARKIYAFHLYGSTEDVKPGFSRIRVDLTLELDGQKDHDLLFDFIEDLGTMPDLKWNPHCEPFQHTTKRGEAEKAYKEGRVTEVKFYEEGVGKNA